MATPNDNMLHTITVIPKQDAPTILQLKFGDMVKIDFTKAEFRLPPNVFVGVDSIENMRFQPDNSNVQPYNGFFIRGNDNGTLSFSEKYLKEHILYFTSDEKDTVLTIKLVLDVLWGNVNV